MAEEKPIIEEKNDTEEKVAKAAAVSYYEAVGRRKEASARTRLYVVKDASMTIKGIEVAKGAVIINGRPSDSYFPTEVAKKMLQETFRTTNTIGRFAVSIQVTGGGLSGQLGAVIHGISRALEKVDKEKFRPILKKRGFMTRDSRTRQRRQPGKAGKSRARKQSPKR